MEDERRSFPDRRFDGYARSRIRILLACFFVSLVAHVAALVLLWSITRGAAFLAWRDAGRDTADSALSGRALPIHLRVELRGMRATALEVKSAPATGVQSSSDGTARNRGDPGGLLKGRMSLPLPTYHAGKELTKQPQLAGDFEDSVTNPDIPAVGGSLLLRLYLGETGRVDSVHVLQSTLPRDVEGAVVQSFFRARYFAGEIDGVPVMSQMTLFVEMGSAEQPASTGALR